MKKAIVFVISCAVLVGGVWLAREVAFGQATEKEEGVTKTKAEWEKLVQERVALALAKEKSQVSDQKIAQLDNWHIVIFRAVEYTIYTGPGAVINARPVPTGQPRGTAPRSGGSRPRSRRRARRRPSKSLVLSGDDEVGQPVQGVPRGAGRKRRQSLLGQPAIVAGLLLHIGDGVEALQPRPQGLVTMVSRSR